MRVTSEFWVSALMRRVFSAGGFAAVVRRGATEAGAVFIHQRDRMGRVELYAPAPQTSYDEARPDDRYFVRLTAGEQDEADRRIEKELRFDPDIWVVEVETADISDLIRLADA